MVAISRNFVYIKYLYVYCFLIFFFFFSLFLCVEMKRIFSEFARFRVFSLSAGFRVCGDLGNLMSFDEWEFN